MAHADARLQALLAEADWLQGLARRLVGEVDADDVVQEVWMRAFGRPPERLDSPRGWLRSVLRSVHLRRIERREAALARERQVARNEALPSSSELVERAEGQRWLVEAVLALREPYQRAILLHYFEGLSAAEIARRSGAPASTVRNQLSRGLAQLREHLDQRPEGREGWLSSVALLAYAPREGAVTVTALGAGSFVMWKIVAAVAGLLALLWTGSQFIETSGERADSEPLISEPSVAEGELVAGEPESTATEAAPEPERQEVAQESQAAAAPESVAPHEAAATLPAGLIQGWVVDPEGQPVPDATVYEGTLAQVAMGLRLEGTPERPSVRTDEEGRFSIDVGDAQGVVICASAEGFAGSEGLGLDLRERDPAEPVTLALRVGVTITGVVYGKDQLPVAGRGVQISSPDLGEFHDVKSDENGAFELNHLNPGPWRAATFPSKEELLAQGEEPDTTSMMAQLAQAQFEVPDGESYELILGKVSADSPHIDGRLLRDGEPIGGLMQWYPVSRLMEKKVIRADEDGNFEVDLPEPGVWIVHANDSTADSRGKRIRLDLAPGQTEELIIDLRGATISGRIVDVEGEPLEDVRVELRTVGSAPHQPDATMGGTSNSTDADGRYQFELLVPGRYIVVAHGTAPRNGAPFYGAAHTAPFEIEGLDDVDLPDLEVEEGRSIVVSVTDGTGRPIGGASLYFHGPSGEPLNPTTWTRTGSKGTARSPAFAPGPLWVTAVHRSGASRTMAFNVDADERVDLLIGSEHWIELAARDGWVDLAGDHIELRDEAGRRWIGLVDIPALFESRPAQDEPLRPLYGSFPPGTYSARVTRPDGTQLVGEVEIAPESAQIHTLWVE
ncbi:MAG: sigma-70 family RNA polymerase sigma factor [Planctomycetota bacterium]|jgi:RNA polymerase sigma-70 factor (ECF subfamily)